MYPWYFAAFSKFLLDTFVSKLVFLTHPSLRLVEKNQTVVFNLFTNDLILFKQCCTLSNYADDNNLFSMSKNKDEIKNILSSDLWVVND